jgi:hypothetical protein
VVVGKEGHMYGLARLFQTVGITWAMNLRSSRRWRKPTRSLRRALKISPTVCNDMTLCGKLLGVFLPAAIIPLWPRWQQVSGMRYILSAIVFLGFLIQLAWISLTDDNLSPRIIPVPPILTATGYVGILISVLAPALSGVALVTVRSASKNDPLPSARTRVCGVVGVAGVVSLFEFLWTCGGHPTWFQGFVG